MVLVRAPDRDSIMAADLSMQLAWKGTARYEVLGCLGQGGMGIVYEVFDRQRCERVALKTLLLAIPRCDRPRTRSCGSSARR